MIIMFYMLSYFIAMYLSAYTAYSMFLFVVHFFLPEPAEYMPNIKRRFNVVVPAHNEEKYIARLLNSLQSQNYDNNLYAITVVADNCSDETVNVCKLYNVTVMERRNLTRIGKGYAIHWAIERIDMLKFDAIVIVDADSIVTNTFIAYVNLEMDRGDKIIQCYNGVANPNQSWFTRLMNVSRSIGNEILHPAKRKLGLSSYLMGNGMCFETKLISERGWNAFSVGEDWEFYARLIMDGFHVGYSRQAKVYHQESIDLRQASSQRLRWSSGRLQVIMDQGIKMLINGVKKRDLLCFDAALPLIFPNPSLGINLNIIGLLCSFVMMLNGSALCFFWLLTLVLLQILMFTIGIFVAEGQWWKNGLSCLLAPLFLGWKCVIDVLSLLGYGRSRWSRTERK